VTTRLPPASHLAWDWLGYLHTCCRHWRFTARQLKTCLLSGGDSWPRSKHFPFAVMPRFMTTAPTTVAAGCHAALHRPGVAVVCGAPKCGAPLSPKLCFNARGGAEWASTGRNLQAVCVRVLGDGCLRARHVAGLWQPAMCSPHTHLCLHCYIPGAVVESFLGATSKGCDGGGGPETYRPLCTHHQTQHTRRACHARTCAASRHIKTAAVCHSAPQISHCKLVGTAVRSATATAGGARHRSRWRAGRRGGGVNPGAQQPPGACSQR